MTDQFLNTPLGIGAVAFGLSLMPVLLLMITPFLKLTIVFGVLRIGFGSQGVPGPATAGALALVLSLYVAGPFLSAMFEEVKSVAVPPLAEGAGKKAQSTKLVTVKQLEDAVKRVLSPAEDFLKRHTGPGELSFFRSRAREDSPEIFTLIPAFVLSELRAGFAISLYLFMPFLVIDLLVTSVLTGMGMMMVNPVTIAFPLKLLLFVSCDGWLNLTEGLLQSYKQ